MSIQESKFLKWFGGIAATLLVGLVIWTFTILSSYDVMANKVEHNTRDITEIKTNHKDDLKEIKQDVKDIKAILMR